MRGNVPINLRDPCTAGREPLLAQEGEFRDGVKNGSVRAST
jgi:hypothetical protein